MALSAEWRKSVIRGFKFQTPALFLLTVTVIGRSGATFLTNQVGEAGVNPVPNDSAHNPTDMADSSPEHSVVSVPVDSGARLRRTFMRFGRAVSGENSLRVCYPVTDRKILSLHRFLSTVQQRPGGKRFMRFGRSGADDDVDQQLVYDDEFDVDHFTGNLQDAALKRFMRFGKRFMRFGRPSSIQEVSPKPVAVICFRKDTGIMSSLPGKRFMRFGRMPNGVDVEAEDALAEPTPDHENA